VGHRGVYLIRVHDAAGVVPVGLCLRLQSGKGLQLFVGPGDEQSSRALDGDAGLCGVGPEKPVAPGHQPGLKRSWLGVETGVEDGGVGLAGSVADIGLGLEERYGQVGACEVSRDGGSDDAGPDDRHVESLH
jgi:hypothetical protein